MPACLFVGTPPNAKRQTMNDDVREVAGVQELQELQNNDRNGALSSVLLKRGKESKAGRLTYSVGKPSPAYFPPNAKRQTVNDDIRGVARVQELQELQNKDRNRALSSVLLERGKEG
jgi:hypothetical protein